MSLSEKRDEKRFAPKSVAYRKRGIVKNSEGNAIRIFQTFNDRGKLLSNIVGDNHNQAAKTLHICRKTLYRKMRKFNILG